MCVTNVIFYSLACLIPTGDGFWDDYKAVVYVDRDASVPTFPENIPNDVTYLHIGRKNLPEIKANNFSQFHDLLMLTVSSSHVQNISDLAFNGTAIERLHLNGNDLHGEVPNFCVLNKTLKYLELHTNYFTNFPSEHLACLGLLEELSMWSNKLVEMPDLQALPNRSLIKDVEVAINRIPCIPADTFRKLESLQVLSLHTQDVPEFTFPDLTMLPASGELYSLSVYSNRLGNLSTSAIEAFKQQNVQILFISFEDGVLDQLLPGIQHSLIFLNVHDDDNVFGTTTDDITMPYVPNLYALKFKLMPALKELPDISVLNLTLEELRIKHCPTFNPEPQRLLGMLAKMTQLTTLDILSCSTTQLPDLTTTTLTTLKFNDCPVVCDCKMAWMKRVQKSWFHPLTITTTGLTCGPHNHLAGKLWNDLSMSNLTEACNGEIGYLYIYIYDFIYLFIPEYYYSYAHGFVFRGMNLWIIKVIS